MKRGNRTDDSRQGSSLAHSGPHVAVGLCATEACPCVPGLGNENVSGEAFGRGVQTVAFAQLPASTIWRTAVSMKSCGGVEGHTDEGQVRHASNRTSKVAQPAMARGKTLMMGPRQQPSGEMARDVLASVGEAAQTSQVGIKPGPHEVCKLPYPSCQHGTECGR